MFPASPSAITLDLFPVLFRSHTSLIAVIVHLGRCLLKCNWNAGWLQNKTVNKTNMSQAFFFVWLMRRFLLIGLGNFSGYSYFKPAQFLHLPYRKIAHPPDCCICFDLSIVFNTVKVCVTQESLSKHFHQHRSTPHATEHFISLQLLDLLIIRRQVSSLKADQLELTSACFSSFGLMKPLRSVSTVWNHWYASGLMPGGMLPTQRNNKRKKNEYTCCLKIVFFGSCFHHFQLFLFIFFPVIHPFIFYNHTLSLGLLGEADVWQKK